MPDALPFMRCSMRIEYNNLMPCPYFLHDQITRRPALSGTHATEQQPWIFQEILQVSGWVNRRIGRGRCRHLTRRSGCCLWCGLLLCCYLLILSILNIVQIGSHCRVKALGGLQLSNLAVAFQLCLMGDRVHLASLQHHLPLPFFVLATVIAAGLGEQPSRDTKPTAY